MARLLSNSTPNKAATEPATVKACQEDRTGNGRVPAVQEVLNRQQFVALRDKTAGESHGGRE